MSLQEYNKSDVLGKLITDKCIEQIQKQMYYQLISESVLVDKYIMSLRQEYVEHIFNTGRHYTITYLMNPYNITNSLDLMIDPSIRRNVKIKSTYNVDDN